MGDMTVGEAAKKWNISTRRVQKLCKDGRIDGAKKFGKSWVVPENTAKPIDQRKFSDTINEIDNSSKRIMERVHVGGMKILSKSPHCAVYYFENETGTGVVTEYEVFEGISCLYNDMHLSKGHESAARISAGVLEINHCREGRFECLFDTGQFAYVGPGDLALNTFDNIHCESCFPMAHYHGITILVELEKAQEAIHKAGKALGGINISINNIVNKLDGSFHVIKGYKSVEHIFSELYNLPEDNKIAYLALKVLELLIFLENCNLDGSLSKSLYLEEDRVYLIRKIKDYIIQNIHKRITVKELSQQFNISQTALKKYFKIVYNKSISDYSREYRMHLSTELLANSDESIEHIAYRLGFLNPAKFSEAFKKMYSMTPTDYRKNMSSRIKIKLTGDGNG